MTKNLMYKGSLLQNGDFEQQWVDNHHCRVFPNDAPAYNTEVGNIFTPEGWTTWFRHDTVYIQPEVRDAWKSGDPQRIHGGQKATLLFTFGKRHDAGLYQQVNTEPGTHLRLTAYAHAWSNHQDKNKPEDFPHPDDPRWSEGASYAEVAFVAGDYPDNTGDPQTDAIPNFTFTVGIDPTGDIDPYADTVIWGEGYHIYNGYAKQLLVEAEAEAATITVFLRSKTRWPFKHNDAYWDDVVLEIVHENPTYQSTILVLPQDATPEQLVEVLEAGYPDRRTFGFSHDDAGNLANVTNGTAVLYNIPQNKHQDFIDYYAARYPNAHLDWAYTSDWVEPTKWDEYLLWQCNPQWGSQGIGRPGCTGTVCSDGCYLTNLAVTQRIYGIRADATPVTVHQTLGDAGYSASSPCRPLWAAIESNLSVSIIGTGDLDAHLAAGRVAMIEVQPTSLEHFVLAVEKRGEDYLILDPWHNEITLLSKRYTGVESYRLLSRAQAPPPPPPPTNTIGNLGLHQQTIIVGSQTYHALPPSVSKVFTLQDLRGMIQWTNGESVVVFRHYNNDQGQFLENPDPMAGARLWIDQFRDSLHQIVGEIRSQFPDLSPDKLVIESLNETVCSLNQESNTRAAKFDEAFILALNETGLPVRAGVFCTAVGNPHESEFDIFLPLARLAQQYGAYFGYHTYFLVNPGYGGPDHLWQYLAGRWTQMDKYFTDRGVYVKWYGGESGAVGGASGEDVKARIQKIAKQRAQFRDGMLPYSILLTPKIRAQIDASIQWVSLYPCDGWKSDKCYNGDWDKYLVDLMRLDELTTQWNQTHQYRHVGHVIFTSGEPWTGWPSFQFKEPQMQGLAAALRARYG